MALKGGGKSFGAETRFKLFRGIAGIKSCIGPRAPRLKRLVGYAPPTDLEEGLRNLGYYKKVI